MIRTVLPALALCLSAGLAQAQSASATRTAHEAGGPPGTVGALASTTYGIATSPQDVALQQHGLTTMAQGARPILTGLAAPSVAGAPGTVGAAPGSTLGK